MASIAYIHDGTSVYDELFLSHLTKDHTVYFLTFNTRPRVVPKRAHMVTLREPFLLFPSKEWAEGLRMYIFSFLRAIILALYLRRIKPSIVLGCMATKYGFYSNLFKFRPLVLIVWGSDILIAPKRFFLFRFMAKYSLKKADAVILDSEVQREAAIQLGCNPSKILKFPWFNLADVNPKISKTEVRGRLGWRNNTIIVSARSHEPIYGVEDLIEAIPHIVKEATKSRFLIIGEGGLTQKLKKRVRALHLEKYVKFTGSLPREDVVAYVNASDIYVSTSLSDGTSASLLEAMTLGIPSVVTSIPGNKEWIEDGCNGSLVPTKDPNRLAEAIISLLKNKDLRRKLGEKAAETVNVKVNWPQNSQAMANLILTLIRDYTERGLT